MLLFWRYSKICNSIPIQIGQFIHLMHFSILQAVNKIHRLYANAAVQPSVQYYSCYIAWKTNVHTWCRYCHFCINAPMWREKRWLQGIFDPPSYYKDCAVPYVRHFHTGYGILHCDSMNHKVMLHWITMKYAVSRMKMLHWAISVMSSAIPDLPATDAVMRHAMVAATKARIHACEISLLRWGTRGIIPPNMTPRLPRFENPHNA